MVGCIRPVRYSGGEAQRVGPRGSYFALFACRAIRDLIRAAALR